LRFLVVYLVLYGLGVIAVIVLAPGGLASLASLPQLRRASVRDPEPIICRAGVTSTVRRAGRLDGIDLDVPKASCRAIIAQMAQAKPRCSMR